MKYEERIQPKQPIQDTYTVHTLYSTIFYTIYEVLVLALVYCIHILSIDI